MSDNEIKNVIANQVGASLDTSLDVSKALATAKQNNQQGRSNITTVTANELTHGDIVVTSDGGAGIVIDSMNEIKKIKESSNRLMTFDTFVDPNDTTLSGNKGLQINISSDAIIDELTKKKGPSDDNVRKLIHVHKTFNGLAPGPNGLVPEGSLEAVAYADAWKALETGTIRLPTILQHEAQKKELENKGGTIKMNQEINKPVEVKEEIQPIQVQPAPAPINMAVIEQSMRQPTQAQHIQQPTQVVSQPQPIDKERITQFVVPEGNVSKFTATLSDEDRQKVSTSTVINIQEVKNVTVPVATGRISSINEYKRIVPQRISGDIVERPLVNSGYVAYVRGCGSLTMASIVSDDPNNVDYAKRYQFCFQNLVTTSIGDLSFSDFQLKTDPNDLDALIHAILQASQSDEQTITLTCGRGKCKKEYPFKYRVSELLDFDNINDETKARIAQIMAMKDILEDAKALQETSPIMNFRYIEVGDGLGVVIKVMDGPMVVERTPLLRRIAERYNPLVSYFLLYVQKMFRTIYEEDDVTKKDVWEIVDPNVIAEELQAVTDTQLEVIKEEILKLKTYEPLEYSFKTIKCPHCGQTEEKVPCDISDLVFLRVSKVVN
jgi:hypothetical protein